MRVSVEISLYPLRDDFVPPIEAFLERLRAHPGLDVLTNTMSTRVFGEYDAVFEALREAMRATHEATPHAVFVAKVVGADLSPGDGPYP